MDRNRHMATRTATTLSQADEALRRARAADRDVYEQLARRTGLVFLDGLRALPAFKPRPGADLGLLHVALSVVDGPALGAVDIDPVNLSYLAEYTARRAAGLHAKHARLARPTLRLIGGGQ
jgi:hypothetical protein